MRREGKQILRSVLVSVALLAVPFVAGCDQRSQQTGAAAPATAAVAGEFDPFTLQRAAQTDGSTGSSVQVPAILVPDEPMPLGYLAPPPREMIVCNTVRPTLGVPIENESTQSRAAGSK